MSNRVRVKPSDGSYSMQVCMDGLRASLQKEVASISMRNEALIAAGQWLNRMQDALPAGQWQSKKKELSKIHFGLSARKIDYLQRNAKNPVLSASQNSAKLPPSYSKQDDLSAIPPDTLQSLIDEGEVHPDLSGKDVKDLVARVQADKGEHPLLDFIVEGLKLRNEFPDVGVLRPRMVKWVLLRDAIQCVRSLLDEADALFQQIQKEKDARHEQEEAWARAEVAA